MRKMIDPNVTPQTHTSLEIQPHLQTHTMLEETVTGLLRDLQVVYPAPRSFLLPMNYTKGVERIYGVELSCLLD